MDEEEDLEDDYYAEENDEEEEDGEDEDNSAIDRDIIPLLAGDADLVMNSQGDDDEDD